ncbi:hypothetical protein [Gaoshiqia sediminis]|uniref:Uncharacterized protein n=1 Tax=Gaoshiqia sediminis TaxID=2986998 RepID=A0AA42C648_9BACT|nr:hypothetical protein [Gaoshiqia sediminis]MCW0483528.1 hypothetical protein [Gaoshiqia sediminis]
MTRTKLVLIILVSFLTSNLVTAQQIRKFESSLGKKRTAAINEIVNDFEKYLDSNFLGKKLDSKYDKYLEELSKGNLSKKWRISPSNMTKYKKLKLFDEFGTVRADTVWYDGELVNYIWENDDLIQSIVPFNDVSIDTIIDETKNEIFTQMQVEGKFYIALETIYEENSLVRGLLDSRFAQGNFYDKKWYAGELFKAKLDYSDYFVKRIIAIGTNEFE